jgi:uncharacterized delta-60 repeat protein
VTRNRIARLNANGSLDTGFNPSAGGTVTSVAVQADGKVLIGGSFTTVGGVTRNRIARLNADGSLDTIFNPDVSTSGSSVSSIAVQTDGKVLIGGSFTTVGGVTRNYVARLNADGSLDTGFNPNANSTVNSLAVQADGEVLVGGAFTTIGALTRNRIARLVNDPSTQSLTTPELSRIRWSRGGAAPEVEIVVFEQSLDNGATWSLLGAGARVGVTSDWELTGLSLSGSTKVRVTGRTSGGQNSASSGLIRQEFPAAPTVSSPRVSLVTATGATLGGSVASDGGAAITERGVVYSATVTNADPLIGGTGVTKLTTSGTTGVFTIPVTGLVEGLTYTFKAYAINSYGTSYTAGVTIPNGYLTNLALGSFTSSLSPGFVPGTTAYTLGVSNSTTSISVTPTRSDATKIEVRVNGGSYATVASGSTSAGLALNVGSNTVDVRVTSEDGTFQKIYSVTVTRMGPATVNTPTATSITATGATLGGNVASDGGSAITERGVVYSTFASNADPFIAGTGVTKVTATGTTGTFTTAVTGLSAGTVYSYKAYATNAGGTTYSTVGSFTAGAYGVVAGDLDTGFNPNANSTVTSVAVQADGKVLIGGLFSSVGGVTRNYIARLNADGSLDTGFNPNANLTVNSVALQADGKVLIGGSFTTVGGVTRNYVARLNTDGTVDTGFNPNANNTVFGFAVQADGKVLIAGDFTTMGGVARNRIARVNADGSLDPSFNPDANSTVTSLAVQADGRVLAGGAFSTMGGSTRNRLSRLVNDPATQSLTTPDGTRARWVRGGTAPELVGVVFEQSLDDGTSWSLLGAGARVGVTANWELTGLSLGLGSKVRATGRTAAGRYNGSSGLIRQEYVVAPTVTAPTVTTPSATSITTTGATLGGNVTGDGGAAITERGVVYSATATNADPLIDGTGVTKLTATGTTGVFIAAVTGLTQGTGYSYKAYATNSNGTTYTTVATFSTLSTNANLSALSLSSGTLSPSFAGGTTSYTASVSNATTSITVTPTVAQANATIEARVNGGSYAAVTSGSASGTLSINVGGNTVDVRVTAQDGTTQKTYAVTVTRQSAAQTAFSSALSTFATSAGLPANAAPSTDSDGDGKTNLEEFAFGTNPASNSSGTNALSYTGTFAAATLQATGQPVANFEPSATGTDYRAVFMRRADHATTGLTYTVQFSANMSTWSTSGVTPTVLATSGDYQLVTVRYPLFVAGRPARFFRIVVTQP